MLIYTAPTLPTKFTSVSLFLAGSIENNSAKLWQNKLIEELSETLPQTVLEELTILNPRRSDWKGSLIQHHTNQELVEQINWEINYLNLSSIAFMYLDENTKSIISMLELGMLATSRKLIVYCPNNFHREANVHTVCVRHDIPIYSNYKEAFDYLCAKISMLVS